MYAIFNPDKVDTSDFEFLNISVDELRGVFDSANHTFEKIKNGNVVSKHEKRMARYLLKAYYWIEREAYATVKGINKYDATRRY
jgi:hypothetical protein